MQLHSVGELPGKVGKELHSVGVNAWKSKAKRGSERRSRFSPCPDGVLGHPLHNQVTPSTFVNALVVSQMRGSCGRANERANTGNKRECGYRCGEKRFSIE